MCWGKKESKHSLCSNMKYLNLQRYLDVGILISEKDLPCYIILFFCFHKDKVVLHRKKNASFIHVRDISLLSELAKHKTVGKKSRFVLSHCAKDPDSHLLILLIILYLGTTEDFVLESEWYYMHKFTVLLLLKTFLICIALSKDHWLFLFSEANLFKNKQNKTITTKNAIRCLICLKQHWHPEADNVNCRLVGLPNLFLSAEVFQTFSIWRLKTIFRQLKQISNLNWIIIKHRWKTTHSHFNFRNSLEKTEVPDQPYEHL